MVRSSSPTDNAVTTRGGGYRRCPLVASWSLSSPVMNCPACGVDNRSGRRFCRKCGAALERLCAACGAANQEGDEFCGECGAALAAA